MEDLVKMYHEFLENFDQDAMILNDRQLEKKRQYEKHLVDLFEFIGQLNIDSSEDNVIDDDSTFEERVLDGKKTFNGWTLEKKLSFLKEYEEVNY